jgi:tRNA(Ile)-lysidine synthase
MLQTFKNHINSKFPLLKKAKILVAISGGIDSVVLANLLYALNYDIALAHCNFKLRAEESDADAVFVKQLAKDYKIEFFTRSFNTNLYASENQLSIQMAARELRYHWFQEILTQHKFDHIATAHHHDDVLETFIINLSRGTGLDGLCSIPDTNGHIFRPLLPFCKEEILNYAKEEKLLWREDKSNSSIKYKRNKIRHQITPLLKELNPSFLESFKKTINNLRESKELIDLQIDNFSKQIAIEKGAEIHLDCAQILKLLKPKVFLFHFFKKYNFNQWEDIFRLLKSQTGKKVWSSTHQILKNREHLILSDIDKKIKQAIFLINKSTEAIEEPIDLKFKTRTIGDLDDYKSILLTKEENKNIEFIDASKISYPLLLRKWQPGDYFYPIGLKGRKKISNFFKDKKYSLNQKENIWLLVSGNQEIVWIIGERLDRRFIVAKETTSLIEMSLNPKL